MGNQKLHLKTQRNQLMRQAIIVTLLVSTLLTFAQTVTVSPHRSRKFLSANYEMPAVVDTVAPTPTYNMGSAPAPTNNMGGGQNAMNNMGSAPAPVNNADRMQGLDTQMYNANQMQGMGTQTPAPTPAPTNNMGGGQNAMNNMGSAPAPVNNADQMQGLDTPMYNANQMQGMGTQTPDVNAETPVQGMGTQMYNADEMEGMGGQTNAMNNTNAMEGMGNETSVVNTDAMDVTQMNNDYQTQVMDTETPVVKAEQTQEMPNPLNNANNMKDMGGQFDTQCPQGTPKWLCTAYHLTQRFTVEQIEAHARRTRCTMEYFAKEYPNKSFTEAVGMVDQNSVVFTSKDFCNGNPVMENLTRYFDPSTPFVDVEAGFQCIASQITNKVTKEEKNIGEMTADDALVTAKLWFLYTPTVEETHIVAPCAEHNNMPAVNQEQADMNVIGWLSGFVEMEKHTMQSELPKLNQQIQVGICIINFIKEHFQGQQHTLGEVKQWVEFGGLHEHTC